MKKIHENYWVYILLCENNSYYTGYTTDLAKRYFEHTHGTGGCKYTRSFKPVAIAQCWQVKDSKSLAMSLEKTIKQLSKAQKNALILTPSSLSSDIRVQPITNEMVQIILASKKA